MLVYWHIYLYGKLFPPFLLKRICLISFLFNTDQKSYKFIYIMKWTESCTKIEIMSLYSSMEKEMATHSSVLGLENPVDRGAWWATVHGVTQSQTRLKSDITFRVISSSLFISWLLSLLTVRGSVVWARKSAGVRTDTSATYWLLNLGRSIHLPAPPFLHL